MGREKTALGVEIALTNARAGVPVIVFSIEMSGMELCKRFLVASTSDENDQREAFSASRVRNPRTIPDKRWGELCELAVKVGDIPIIIDDRGSINE